VLASAAMVVGARISAIMHATTAIVIFAGFQGRRFIAGSLNHSR
jgi:hypothetical protein